MNLQDTAAVEPAGNHFGQIHPPFRPQRILVAEDYKPILEIVSGALDVAGYEVQAASDGLEAWELLSCGNYDALITDNEMPRLCGVQLVLKLRDAGMSMPVIMASGFFPPQEAQVSRRLRLAAVVPKPYDVCHLVSAVKAALRMPGENAVSGAVQIQLQTS